MSISLSRPFIERPIATSLLMFALFFSGVIAMALLPISALPEVDYPTIRVSTYFPGASPEVMVSGVTAPLERQFGQMPGLNQMTSSSSNGSSQITLQFNLDMTLDVAEQQVQAAINAASSYLPINLPLPPVYSKVNPADTPIITLALNSSILSLREIEDLADTRLAQKLSQVSGVGLVSISGGQKPAIRIQINPTAALSYGVTLEQIRNTIAAANVNAPKGNFDGEFLAYTINANDQLLKSKDYQDLIIAYHKGSPLRLSDVASVTEGVENTYLAAWMNKTPTVIMNIQRQPGSNVIEVADKIKELLPKLSANLPKSIDVSIVSDRTHSIRSSVAEAKFEMMISIFLVVMVIFVFLRNLPATLIPSIAVPLSLVGTLGAMYLFGFSLNNLTLMALTIATGFVVDDAIVMIENIARYVEQKISPRESAEIGSKQIGFTILSLTLSLLGVLIPLLFMSDIIGRLFREFALTLSITILLSAFISLTLTPMLCARILRNRSLEEESHFEKTMKEFFEKCIAWYARSLKIVLQYRPLIIIMVIGTVLLTGLLFYGIPKGFFPTQDTGMILGISEASQSISFEAMAAKQQALANVVLEEPDVQNVSSFIGIDGTNTTLNRGRMLITLKPIAERTLSAREIIQNLNKKLDKVIGAKLYLQPVQDISIDDRISLTQYQYSLSGVDEKQVAFWSEKLVKKLSESKELQDVASDLQNAGLQAIVNYDRNTASRLGINAQLIDDTLYDAFGQRQISIIFTQLNQYRVVMEVQPEWQQNLSAFKNIRFTNSTGDTIPLGAIVSIHQGVGPILINRQGQFPVSIISFNLANGATLGDAIHIINQACEDIGLPKSIQNSFEVTAKTFQNSLKNEGFLFLAAIIVVYIILGILYESYIHPITILSTLPSACVGALLTLYLTGNELSIIALIGIILLVGIVMKNAILMIDFALEQERIYYKSAEDAIYEACLLRFRPILMTTLAALFGAVPLALGDGMGAELRQPLGIAIIGGLMLSQILTLYTTPVIYLVFNDIAIKLGQYWNAIRIRRRRGGYVV
jgi:multidrug efflux pump